MGELDNHIDKIKQETKDLEVLSGKILSGKVQFTNAAIVSLMQAIRYGIEKIVELKLDDDEPEYYDKEFGKQFCDSMEKMMAMMANMPPPAVTVTPKISIDLKPLQGIAENISEQNKSLISLIEKFNKGSPELHKEIAAMVGKQNEFIEKGFKQIDYTKEMMALTEAVKNAKPSDRPIVTKLRVNRDGFGITEVIPEYKKQ